MVLIAMWWGVLYLVIAFKLWWERRVDEKNNDDV